MDSSLAPNNNLKEDSIKEILKIYSMMNEAGSGGHMNASSGRKILSIMREKGVSWTDLAPHRINKENFKDLVGPEAKLMPAVN